MTTILHIDASVRGERSLGRRLSKHFVETWKLREPGTAVIARDVGRRPPPIITEAWIAAVFTNPEERTAEQRAAVRPLDELIGELDRAAAIVMGAPMYNYGMPAALKAWFDQVIRINKTFTFDLARGDYPLEPVMKGKTLVILSPRCYFEFARRGRIRTGRRARGDEPS